MASCRSEKKSKRVARLCLGPNRGSRHRGRLWPPHLQKHMDPTHFIHGPPLTTAAPSPAKRPPIDPRRIASVSADTCCFVTVPLHRLYQTSTATVPAAQRLGCALQRRADVRKVRAERGTAWPASNGCLQQSDNQLMKLLLESDGYLLWFSFIGFDLSDILLNLENKHDKLIKSGLPLFLEIILQYFPKILSVAIWPTNEL